MVLPLIGAALGAGGSIIGGLMGAEASADAQALNWAINLYNNRQRRKERQESMDYAEELRNEGKLGATDAQGTRTFFKEGEGWVTELGAQPQRLLDHFLGQELPERQEQFKRKASNSREADDIAGALFDEFRRTRRGDVGEAEAQLYEKSSRGIDDAQRASMETAMRSALQTGSSNAGKIAADISRAGMEASGNARKDAALQARDYVDSKYDKDRSGKANLLNMFLQQAGADIGMSYDPSGDVRGATSLMSQFSGGDDAANQMGAAALNKTTGSMDYIEPDYGGANAAVTIGNSIAGLGNRAGSYFDQQNNNKLLEQFLTQGGQLNFGQGGIFGAMTDRVKPNSGWF